MTASKCLPSLRRTPWRKSRKPKEAWKGWRFRDENYGFAGKFSLISIGGFLVNEFVQL